MDKIRKYLKSAIFIWYKNGRQQLLGVQSIKAGSHVRRKHKRKHKHRHKKKYVWTRATQAQAQA